jgi:translation elongation factor EF-Ts
VLSAATFIQVDKLGFWIELGCESDFVARSEDFLELMHDLAMQIAASDPKFIRKEDVTSEAYEREKDIYASQAAATGKPPEVVERIVEGKMSRFYEEVCLNEQLFIKDQTVTIAQLISAKANKLGERIAVRRFARFKVGDNPTSVVDNRDRGPQGGDEAGIAVKNPKRPKSGSGFAAASSRSEATRSPGFSSEDSIRLRMAFWILL